jgi:glycosyltransferase involved in cell wall biosynthesis
VQTTISAAPTVTVVIPVYNRDSALRRAIDSVRRQTLGEFECVVVDDASDHDIADIVASYCDPRLRVIRREVNGGPYAARFTGMQAVRGTYAFFLDSDHELYPWALAQARHYLDKTPNVDLVCGLFVRNEDSRLFVRVRDAPRVVTPEELRVQGAIPDRIAAVRRCVVDEFLDKRSDYFAFEVHQTLTFGLNHAALYVDEPWSIYNLDAGNRVTERRADSRQLDDLVRFLEEHWQLIAHGGPYVLLDMTLKTAYFALWRRHRPEAAMAAEALRLRGMSPRRALLEVGLRKAQMRLPSVRRNDVTWV